MWMVDQRRLEQPYGRLLCWLAMLLIGATACSPVATEGATSRSSPTSRDHRGVTLVLERSSDGDCCAVSTSNPDPDAIAVFCMVDTFDDSGRYLLTVVVPPKPAGHRRSSGFVAEPGLDHQGVFPMSDEVLLRSARIVCRPAAWHGGAPI
jgi:hypothetical protein